MSGFDFGSLRDPDAPQPDSRHRDAVETRAHELRAKTRRNQTLLGALAVIVVVAVVAGILASRPDDDHLIVRNPSTTTTGTVAPTTHPSIDGRFIPPTSIDDGIITLPVTAPDGESFTLHYPQKLKVAQLGFAGTIGVNWPVESGNVQCCGKQVSITYQTIADVYGDATPVHVYRGPNGEPVPFFHASQALKTVVPQYDFLAFQFGPWLVQVYDVTGDSQARGGTEVRMTDAQRDTWARSLTGTVDANGYLLLHAAAPLSLGNGFQGAFGGGATTNLLELAANLYCGQPESDTSVRRRFENEGGSGVSWCAGDLHLSARGTKAFVDLAASDLQVSGPITEVSPSTTTSTTTTTAPPTPKPINGPALSASFVSPEHGWALQKNGDVDETTDAGRTWKTLGSVGTVAYGDDADPQIRFADASIGFIHSSSTVWETVDGGVTWKTIDTPVQAPTVLEISHRVVYVIVYDSDASDFGLWSSPVDQISWHKAFSFPIGAGPVPKQQLVLSGSNGWVINQDRTVMGGAQLTPAGTWKAWTPPCLDVEGPAWFTASSENDLVAACDEHVWGGGTQTHAIYFSHDAGKTFERHDAPAFGEIASPNATTAVVDDVGTLRRTTDGGATWNEVANEKPDAYRAVDLGFTTSTQGFVIFDNGVMLMTYDAGATWSAVTRP